MKKLFAMLFVLLIALSACGLADTEITAQGSAVLTADPDLARVSCGANVRAGSVAQAQQKVTAVIEQVTARLEALGIAKEDIVTDYYGYYPVYDYSDPQGEPDITGYQANHSLVVTCRDVSMLDEVVSAMSDGGMTEFNSIAFDCTGRHELYLEALKRAVEAAREKAGVLAAASGLTLGKTEKVTENAVYDTVYEGASTDAAMESKRAQGTGIRSGSVNVGASVTVQFEAR